MANYLIDSLYLQAQEHGDTDFCGFKAPGEEVWKFSTWLQFLDMVERAACGLHALGVPEKSNIAICAPNSPQTLAAEMAGFFLRCCSVPVYAYSSQEQFDFIVSNSKSLVIFAGSENQLRMALAFTRANPGKIRQIIAFYDKDKCPDCPDGAVISWDEFLALDENKKNMEAVLEIAGHGVSTDLASIIYTSGTTGDPKGVILTHSNFEAAIREHLLRLPEVKPGELSLSFLPLSHVFEKA